MHVVNFITFFVVTLHQLCMHYTANIVAGLACKIESTYRGFTRLNCMCFITLQVCARGIVIRLVVIVIVVHIIVTS